MSGLEVKDATSQGVSQEYTSDVAEKQEVYREVEKKMTSVVKDLLKNIKNENPNQQQEKFVSILDINNVKMNIYKDIAKSANLITKYLTFLVLSDIKSEILDEMRPSNKVKINM